jgi:hypothetical protein
VVLATPNFLTTRDQWVYFRSPFEHLPAQVLLKLCSNAYHHDLYEPSQAVIVRYVNFFCGKHELDETQCP